MVKHLHEHVEFLKNFKKISKIPAKPLSPAIYSS
jgi:hypothetical protein